MAWCAIKTATRRRSSSQAKMATEDGPVLMLACSAARILRAVDRHPVACTSPFRTTVSTVTPHMATKKTTPSKLKSRAPIKKSPAKQPAPKPVSKKAAAKKPAKAATKPVRSAEQPVAAAAPIVDLAALARRASLERLMRG